MPVETVWPPYEPLPGVDGTAALTGLAADPSTTAVPALAVKIDNHPGARPQWGLEGADIVVEENVEGVTRFIAVFHSRYPDPIGPVRSARSGDLALVAAFNRPVLAWSGGNPGVTRAVRAAADAGVLVDLSALREGACFRRASEKRKPHNLVLDPACGLANAGEAGAARPPWTIDAAWTSPAPYGPDSTFDVTMDGVAVGWTWEPDSGLYARSQDGAPHVTMSGVRVMAKNVLVLEVRHTVSVIDTRSPEPVTIGDGDGVLHRDGIATLVHWSRAGATDPFSITTRDGLPVALAPGNSFVELTRAP